MRGKRSNQSEQEKNFDNEEAKERMRRIRAKRSEEAVKEAKEKERTRKNNKVSQDDLEREYKNIQDKHNKREQRKQRSGKEHLLENLKAKKGMRMLREEGNLLSFARRSRKNVDEYTDWKLFLQKGKQHFEKLQKSQPDIVEKINQTVREEKERDRKRKEEAKNGEWDYCGESGEWYWTGESEPPTDNFEYGTMTPELLKIIREQEREEQEAYLTQKNRRLKEKERKEAMSIPIPPFPKEELCAYEKLREKNIKEIEEAMKESKFFETLHEIKKNM